MKKKMLSLAATALLLLLSNSVFVSAEETSINTEATSNAEVSTTNEKPQIAPVIKSIQQEKRVDIKDIRTEKNKKIVEERGALKDTQMKAVEGGLTPEERANLRNARLETRADIKKIRTEQFGEVKLRREEAREDIKIALEERKLKMASTTDARKEERKQKAIERAANLADRMVKRIGVAIERLEKLSVRIQGRIDKVKVAGGAIATAETSLAEANTQIAVAKNGLIDISAAFAAAALMENPKDGREKIREAVKTTNAEIKSAHELLVKAAQSLIGQKGAEVEASTVITPSTQTVDGSATTLETGTTIEGGATQ